MNAASNHVKIPIATSVPMVALGFRSRGGIHKMSVNSFSGGQVTLWNALMRKSKSDYEKERIRTRISKNLITMKKHINQLIILHRSHFFLEDLVPAESCRMDLGVGTELGVLHADPGDMMRSAGA
jgi:hypothetical protein